MSLDPLVRADARAVKLYPRSTAFRGAYMKGVRARLQGQPLDACPYRRGTRSWRPAFRSAWARGWRSLNIAD